MSTILRVAPGTSWPSGNYRDVAVLPLDDVAVSQLFGELLEGTEPGLGDWLAIGFQLPDGGYVELIRYKASPPPFGYSVRLDASDSIEPSLTAVLALTGLEKSLLPWVAPGP